MLHVIVDHRDQDLARSAEFAEAREYQGNGLLQAHVRIEPETVIAVPDIAEGHGDAQFSALCLGATASYICGHAARRARTR